METADCERWRPMAMKGICECGKRWWQHSEEVQKRHRESRDVKNERKRLKRVLTNDHSWYGLD